MMGAIALACGTVPLMGVSPAYAESTTLAGVTSGYFSSTGIRKPDALPASIPETAQPNNLGVDTVSAGNLPVAARADIIDKMSFILFDLLSVERGSTVTKAVLRLPLVPSTEADATFGAEPAKVVACPAGPEGFFGEDGAAIEDAPSAMCDVASAPGKASADGKAYEFDITKTAAMWIDINDGIALLPAAGARTTPFQVVFAKASEAKLTVEYTAPEAPLEELPVTSPPVEFPTDTAPPVDLGGFGGSVAPPPPLDTGSVPPPTVPNVPAPVAGVVPQPAPQIVATTPVALESLRPDTSLWLAALGLAALLAMLSLIMGDGRVPTATVGKSRLSRALADRQRPGTSAHPALGRALPV